MNTEEKIQELTRKALAGDAVAQNSLGVAYHNADGVERDYVKAYEWYERSAEQGNDFAQLNLGVLYYYGYGVEKSNSKAFEWFKKSAMQGNSGAQNYIGIFYENGYGVEKSYSKALEWYSKAASQGNAFAQNNLGLLYHYGRGVVQDYHLAKEWYLKAARNKNKFALSNLGVLFENGLGVRQNFRTALSWYEEAAEQGNEGAKERITSLEKKYNEHLDCLVLHAPSFYNNPFCILGVYSNASARDIAGNKSKMSAYLRIGKKIEFPIDKIVSDNYKPLFDVDLLDTKDDENLTIDDVYKKIKENESEISKLQGLLSTPVNKSPLGLTVEKIKELKSRDDNKNKLDLLKRNNEDLKRLYETKARKLYTVNRTQESVESALASINQPIDKIKYAFFWFIQATTSDKIAFDSWINGDIQKAFDIFYKRDNFSSYINYAIFSFMGNDAEEYIRYMTTIIHDEDYRREFVSTICGDNYHITEEELSHLFIDTLLTELPNEDWITIFTACGPADEDDDYIKEILVKEPIDKLTEAISKSSSIDRSKGNLRSIHGTTLMQQAKKFLPIIEDIIGKNDYKYQQIADKTAREILSCSIDYYKECGERIYNATKKSLELNEYANSIAVGATLKERVKECLKQIQEKYDSLPPESVFNLFSQIRVKISDFAQKPDLIKHSHELLSDTFPLLCEIKEKLGRNSKAYQSIATEVVGNALVNIIAEVNQAFDDVNTTYQMSKSSSAHALNAQLSMNKKVDILKSAIKSSWLEFLNMDQLDLEAEFKSKRYNPNREAIKKHVADFRISTYLMNASLPFKTETEIYNSATTVYGLETYLQRFPNGKYAVQAKAKKDRLIKEDDDFWHSSSQKGDYEGYLRKYKYGRHSKDAQTEIRKRKELEDENYWTACSKTGDYDLYLKKYKTGKHAKEAETLIKKRKSYKNWAIGISIAVVIFGAIAAIWGAQGFMVLFGGIAFLAFCGAVGRGDQDCGTRIVCLVVAAITGAIAYAIANAYNL